MLIIWLQGIWLVLHGYNYKDTPLWSGIYLLPLTFGFVVSGPVSGWLSDKHGARAFASGGLLVSALAFGGLLLMPDQLPATWPSGCSSSWPARAWACSPRPTRRRS